MVCFDFVCFYLNSLVVAVFFSLFILINSLFFLAHCHFLAMSFGLFGLISPRNENQLFKMELYSVAKMLQFKLKSIFFSVLRYLSINLSI